MKTAFPATARRGFTLVELLTVIVIIGILVGLTAGAAIQVRKTARQTVTRTEIEQIQGALESYRTERGEYPPDFALTSDGSSVASMRDAVMRHIHKVFPRYIPVGKSGDATEWDRFCTDVNTAYPLIDPRTFDPAAALVFWLGGLPEMNPASADEPWKPAGFHTDPTFPFKPGLPRTQPLFDFQPERLRVIDPINNQRYLRYYPQTDPKGAPYVYFKARRNPNTARFEFGVPASSGFYPFRYVHDTNSVCTPYLAPGPVASGQPAGSATWDNPYQLATRRNWRNAEKCQILCAGLDGLFGSDDAFRFTRMGVKVPLGTSGTTIVITDRAKVPLLDDTNFDDLTNFAEGTVEDEFE